MAESPTSGSAQVTELLRRATQGDDGARDELYRHVESELRRLAKSHLARERKGHSLQPTLLLDEAYLKLIDAKQIDWVSRGHFYMVAARVMRRVLISRARARNASKRGGNVPHLDLDQAFVAVDQRDPILILLDDALSRLEQESPRAYQLVEMKFFGGLDFEEAALALNVSSRTLRRDWDAAKKWLYREIQENGGTQSLG